MSREPNKFVTAFETAVPLAKEFPWFRAAIVHHIRQYGRLNCPYSLCHADYISDEQLYKGFAGSWCAIKGFFGHFDFARLVCRNGSDPYSCEHKAEGRGVVQNLPTEWAMQFAEGDDYSMVFFQYAVQYWTTPYAAEKINRPSQSRGVNDKGDSKSPFKGGNSLIADLILKALDEPVKKSFSAYLEKCTEENLANGYVGWGGPTAEYAEKCAETREARGVTMARTTRTRGIGIYAKMTQQQDAELSALIFKSHYEDKLSAEELVGVVGKYVAVHCASPEKLEAAKSELHDLTQARNALFAIPSQAAETAKYEAKIEAVKQRAELNADKLQAIVGPATAAALGAVLPKKDTE